MRLDVQEVTWEVEAQRILNEVTLHAGNGEFVGLIGPNGSGNRACFDAYTGRCGPTPD